MTSPFDPNYTPQMQPPTPYERAAAATARKLSARRSEQLLMDGPARTPTAEQKRADKAKNDKIRLGGI